MCSCASKPASVRLRGCAAPGGVQSHVIPQIFTECLICIGHFDKSCESCNNEPLSSKKIKFEWCASGGGCKIKGRLESWADQSQNTPGDGAGTGDRHQRINLVTTDRNEKGYKERAKREIL